MICRLIKNKGLATAPQRHVAARRTNPGLNYRRVFETVSGAMLLAAVLGGCSKESDGGPDGADGKLIKFTPAVNTAGPGTRALPGSLIESDDNIPTGGSFGVYAYGKLTPTSDVVSYNSELRDNTKVTSNGTDFIYNPVARWPIRKDAELTFYGYYPWQDPGTTPAPGSHKISVTMGGQNAPSMSIDYTTPADPSKQVDLMYAYAEPTTGFDPIEMNFGHALTRVRFKARVEDYPMATNPVRITSITVTDVKTFGRLIVEDENPPKWWYQSNDEDIKLADGNGLRPNYALTGTLATVIDTDGDLLLIPQEVKDMVVSVETTIGNGPGATAKTFTYPLSGTSDWEMNQVVTYEITISGDGMKLIAKVNDWAGNDVEVIHDGQWSLTVDKDEVELSPTGTSTVTVTASTDYNITSQGYPAGVSASVPAAYSSWLSVAGSGSPGDLSRTFTITGANPGTGKEGEVLITAGNLTKVVRVSMESIAPRFARSNIVWDAANSKLTFATTAEENTTVAPANAQGVFFKWGSLVAVSPVTASGNAFAASQILFSPRGATYSVWENATTGIPYLDQTNYSSPPFDNNDLTEDDFAGFDDINFPGTSGPGYNANTDRGDICRYITDQGWVPAGERWRLPKQSEYNELMAELTSVSYPASGGFSYINYLTPSTPGYQSDWINGFWPVPSGRWLGSGATADAGTGEQATKTPGTKSVYVPVGGCRGFDGGAGVADNGGFAWSASSYTATNAYCLYVYEYAANWSSNLRNNAFPVRCIREL